jgi:hypothetical protein
VNGLKYFWSEVGSNLCSYFKSIFVQTETTHQLQQEAKLLYDAAIEGDEPSMSEILNHMNNPNWHLFGMFEKNGGSLVYVSSTPSTAPKVPVSGIRMEGPDGNSIWVSSAPLPLKKEQQ